MGLSGFRAQVVALAVLISTGVVAVLVIVTHVFLGRVTDADANALARTRAEAVVANVEVRAGKVVLTESGNEALDTVVWVYADGRLVDGIVPPSVANTVETLARADREQTVRTTTYLLMAVPVSVAEHHVTVVVGVDLEPFQTSEQRSLWVTLILGGLAVLLAGAVAYVATRRALRVVREMAVLADEWGEHDPGRRFNLGEPHDEFGELARTLDHLLDRVERALSDERRLTDEVAHELRTPLTALRGEAQLAQMSGEPVDPERVLVEVDRLTASMTTILDAARTRLPGEGSCDLRAAIMAAVAQRSVEIDIPAQIEVAVAADVVRAVLAPVLDNALRHARGSVRVTMRLIVASAKVTVTDDGPGFTASEAEHAFEAGVSGAAGHGLGLAVVRRIATAAGLDVRAIANSHGEVELTLPLA